MSTARFAVLAGLRAGGRRVSVRGFHSTARSLIAQNFTMPALSPTMTEGNIAQWRVTEGQTFQAGDVLLEIETDKATMDVEAQDEGVLMKIFTQSGSKGIAIGTRIAVVAEIDDDLSTLEIPADVSASPPSSSTSAPAAAASSPAPAAAPKAASGPVASGSSPAQNQTLLPSVLGLVHAHHIDKATLNTIPATGPNGRLTKGDILAYVGSIGADAPGRVKARFDALAKLDLSNIKPAPKPEPKKSAAPVEELVAEPIPQDLEVTLPVSLTKVLEAQHKIRKSLGVNLPLGTFISRASELANDDLPALPRAPSADDMFNAVLGLDSVAPKVSRGFYVPQVEALAETSFLAPPAKASEPKQDIIDVLAGKKAPRAAATGAPVSASFDPANNVFLLVVPEGEANRASVFLERVKLILENEPARLVL
ncbi:pyridoxine biosynthesis protein [Ceratocystis pirilliformis]|uniref:Pyridoxine biosynthesis protein n=1 Tax=Ceratocystis pirilliformis TaxID=259994 RepID=A0ABR3YQX9_9PEZI